MLYEQLSTWAESETETIKGILQQPLVLFLYVQKLCSNIGTKI